MPGDPSATMGAATRIRYAVEGPLARITLVRPEKRNALDPIAIRELRDALEAAGADRSVRAVLLTADGPDFCAGADLESLAALLDADRETHRADARALADLFLALREIPKPVVAAVQGRALAGGAGLVTACDIVVAAADARFGYPEVRIGFVAAMVTALARATIGEKAAFDLLATGRMVAADEAERLGLITRVVPPAELERSATDTARELAALPPDAVARTKRLFYSIEGLPLREALERGVEANVESRGTVAFREGLATFLARRQR